MGPETLPQTERGSISAVKPTGWHTVKYDGIDGNYLYNRCHLIGFQLTGQDANEKNLITGTRYMNVTGMEPYENKVAWYVRTTGKSVLFILFYIRYIRSVNTATARICGIILTRERSV